MKCFVLGCDLSFLVMASLNQRICMGVGGRGCNKRMASVERDPHPLCPSCRGNVCSRSTPCAVCVGWSEHQWALFESRRAYRRKVKPTGGSIPVPGGVGHLVVVPPAPGGTGLSAPLSSQQLGAFDNVTFVRPPGFHIFSSLPSSTTVSPPVWSSIPHFLYGGSLTSLSSHHSLPLVTAAPHLGTLPVAPQPVFSFPVPSSLPLPSSSLPSSLPVTSPPLQAPPPPALPPPSSLLMLPPPSSVAACVPSRLAILPPPVSSFSPSSSAPTSLVYSLPPRVPSVVSVAVPPPPSSVSVLFPPLPSGPLPPASLLIDADTAVYDDDLGSLP